MFEFSLASILLILLVGIAIGAALAKRIGGYVAPAEAALQTEWAKFKAELTALHDMSHQRITSLESIVHPVASAAIAAATVQVAAPDPAKPAA